MSTTTPVKGLIYLASPYSHPEFGVRVQRYISAADAVTRLAKMKLTIFSPIVHWHHIATLNDLPKNFEFWQVQNDPIIEVAAHMMVLGIPGWSHSAGVMHEINLAHRIGTPIEFIQFQSNGHIISDLKSPLTKPEHWRDDVLMRYPDEGH